MDPRNSAATPTVSRLLGQAAYFDLNVDTLKRMAASNKLSLEIRAATVRR